MSEISYETISSSEIFAPLLDFLKNDPLDQITISRIFQQQWNLFKIQTEEADLECLKNLLRKVENEDITNDRKIHLKLLQDDNKIRYSRKELMSLVKVGLLRGKFEEQIDWKKIASNNISILREAIKKENTPAHDHLFKKISETNVDDLTPDDPLCNGTVDLSSDKFQLSESDYVALVKEKACIRMLSKDNEIKNICSDFVARRNEVQKLKKFVLSSTETATHNQWVEEVHERERIAKIVTDVLLQEIRFNAFRKISRGAERQSIASKNRKAQNNEGSRGDKPDLMIRSYHRQRWEELVYFESGKWNASDKKIHDNHNKLVQLCLDGYEEISKKCKKDILYENYMGLGVNIAGECLVIHGLIRENGIKYYLPIAKAKVPLSMESVNEIEEFVHALLTLRNGVIVNLHCLVNSFQTRSRKVSERSSSHDTGRLNKKK
ncbi:29908_t:CDS:2, partial [Gigaspora margarita]